LLSSAATPIKKLHISTPPRPNIRYLRSAELRMAATTINRRPVAHSQDQPQGVHPADGADDKPKVLRSVNGTGKNFKQLETSEIGVGPPSGLYPDGESRPRQQPQQQQQNFFFGSMSHFSFNGVDYFDARLRRQLDEASSTTVEVTAREDDSPVEVLLPFTVRAPQAFAELPTLNLVDGFDLRLRFRTVQTDGLLLISAGGVSRSADFLLLELLNGRLRLALNPGLTSVATQRELPLEPGGRLDDNPVAPGRAAASQPPAAGVPVDGQPAGSAGFVGDVGDGGFNVNVNKNSLYLGGAPRHLMSARSDVILSGIGF
uniref:LAM_G_DOMAIN domain-containing protein n=1 Tax=Macrostomum lignano TaxID=282301 RepID=A0A1I8F7M6_9PLAT